MSTRHEAARGSSHYTRAIRSGRTPGRIISDWERGTLVAGLIIAVSFGLMLVAGAWLGW